MALPQTCCVLCLGKQVLWCCWCFTVLSILFWLWAQVFLVYNLFIVDCSFVVAIITPVFALTLPQASRKFLILWLFQYWSSLLFLGPHSIILNCLRLVPGWWVGIILRCGSGTGEVKVSHQRPSIADQRTCSVAQKTTEGCCVGHLVIRLQPPSTTKNNPPENKTRGEHQFYWCRTSSQSWK